MLALSVPGGGYSRNASCALNLIYLVYSKTNKLKWLCIHTILFGNLEKSLMHICLMRSTSETIKADKFPTYILQQEKNI